MAFGIFEAVAVYGAAVGSVGAAWHIRSVALDRTRVAVSGACAYGDTTGAGPTWMLSVTVSNVGRHTVHIDGIGLDLPTGGRTVPHTSRPGSGVQLPRRLEPGESDSAYFSIDGLREALYAGGKLEIPTRYWARSGTGQMFTGDVDQNAFRSWLVPD